MTSDLIRSVRNWIPYGCCPIEIEERDYGCPGASRLCLVATHCGIDGELYLGEWDSRAEREAARRRLDSLIERVWEGA